MESLCINLDRKVLLLMNKYNLRMEDVFVLLAICLGKHSLLEGYLIDKSDEQKTVALQPLVRKQLLVRDGMHESFHVKRYVLSATGQLAVTELRSAMEIADFSAQKLIPVESEFDKLVREYIELFPAQTKNGGGKILRSHPADVSSKMKKFMVKYKYDAETIIKATRNFIEKLRGNYSYCPAASYFIMKSQESALAGECESIQKNGETIVNPFDERM